jgi:hypothetical protein
MDDDGLGSALTSLALRWPPEPSVTSKVISSIRESERRPTSIASRLAPRRRLVPLVAAAMILALTAVVAIAGSFLVNLGQVTVRVTPSLEPAPSSPLADEDLGRAVSLAEAEHIAGFSVYIPALLGHPDRIWVDEVRSDAGEQSRRIVTAWEPKGWLPQIPGTTWGAVMIRFEGDAEGATKLLLQGTAYHEAAYVDGDVAHWIEGPHEIRLLTDEGIERLTVTGNVLLWQDGDAVVRLETALPKTRSIAIAESSLP